MRRIVTKPPDADHFIEVWRRSVPEDFAEAIETDPSGSFALVRAQARMFAMLARRIFNMAQAGFFLPYPGVEGEPATLGRPAVFAATVRRTADLWRHMIVDAGAMVLVGPQLRRYRNTQSIEWIPYDADEEKTIVFVADVVGEVGNLDFLADEDGNLTNPDGTPDTETIVHADLSIDRTAINGSIETPDNAQARIVDAGYGDQFFASDVGLYVKIEASANPSNSPRLLRIVGFAERAETEPGVIPREIVVDDSPQRFRIQRATTFQSSTQAFTDRTAIANGDVAGPFEPFQAPASHGDILYIGAIGGDGPFTSVVLDIAQAIENAAPYTVAWEYWNGASWATVALADDESSGMRISGPAAVSWGTLAGWAPNTVDTATAYFVRARLVSNCADDFEDGAIASKWSTAGTGTAAESGGDARLTTSGITDVFLGSAYPISLVQQVTGDFDARLDAWARLTTDLGDLDNSVVPVNQAGLAALLVTSSLAFAGVDAIAVGVGYANAATPIRYQRFQRTAGVLGSNTIAGIVHPLVTRGQLRIVRVGQLFTILVRDYNPAVPLESDVGWQTWTTIDRTATPLPNTVFVGPGSTRSGGAFQMLGRYGNFIVDQPTAEPTISTIHTMHPDPLVAEAGSVTWSIYDWSDLGFEIMSSEAPAGGKDDDLSLIAADRGVMRDESESEESFRERASTVPDVVTPMAINRAINRILEPLGFRGKAIDLAENNTDEEASEVFEGLFEDVDALDYYEPGDTFPSSPYRLLLSENEAHGWFFVYLPFLSDGEFGSPLDDGPIITLPDGSTVASAEDSLFLDGFSVDGDAIYQAIYKQLFKIRAFGVGFTMHRDPALNEPECP